MTQTQNRYISMAGKLTPVSKIPLLHKQISTYYNATAGFLLRKYATGIIPVLLSLLLVFCLNKNVNAQVFTAIDGGNSHVCALLSDGTVQCWGSNWAGQLGNGNTSVMTFDSSLTPVMVSGITTATAIATGADHTCAILSDGTVQCWGSNWAGQLGNGTTSNALVPVMVSGITNAIAISAGHFHTCAVLIDGTVRCWGSNTFGGLGDGGTTSSSTPVMVSGITTATAIAAGGPEGHTCAILSDGTTWCWGNNWAGQLGNGTTLDSTTPVMVSGITMATAIAANGNRTCAVLSDGTVRCWGVNGYGELGDGSIAPMTTSATPVMVSGISTATKVAVGYFHVCAVLADGSNRCWGLNNNGQLGDGTMSNSSTPVMVNGINSSIAIAAGDWYTCSLLTEGTVWCWGGDDSGQLGDGTTNFSATPLTAIGISTAMGLDGGEQHTCSLLADGTVWCWGQNGGGQLGYWTTIETYAIPGMVSGVTTATAIAAGGWHTCALLADSTVQCWGLNEYGQLGNAYGWGLVSGITSATAITAGGAYSCALLADGTVWCWGRNKRGQLGNGSTSDSSTPVMVSGITSATAITAGRRHTCALLADGKIWCWGRNDRGQLGNGSTSDSSTPVMVSGIASAKAIDGELWHTCALLVDGTTWCWGDNTHGQLGNGSMSNATTPVMVSGVNSAKEVAVGRHHTCVIRSDNTIWCWGDNTYGQLGNGTVASASTPVMVSGITTAKAISAGVGHTCVVLIDGTVQCWGLNNIGQLGDGTWAYSLTPVMVIGVETLDNTPTGANVNITPVTGITLSFDNVTTPGVTTITTSTAGSTPPPSGFNLGNEPVYYEITSTAVFIGPVDVCFNYNENSYGNENMLRLFHFTGGVWDDITTTLDMTANIICGTTTSFSPFIVAQQASTAVTLSNLSATANGGDVLLTWSTRSEADNEGFVVLRGENTNGPFSPVSSMIPAVGGLGMKAAYTFTDSNVEEGKTYYYRLQDVDSRGKVTEHKVVSVYAGSQKLEVGNETSMSGAITKDNENPLLTKGGYGGVFSGETSEITTKTQAQQQITSVVAAAQEIKQENAELKENPPVSPFDKGGIQSLSLDVIEPRHATGTVPSDHIASSNLSDRRQKQSPDIHASESSVRTSASASSSFSVTIEDEIGNLISISKMNNAPDSDASANELDVKEDTGKIVLTWQGMKPVKGFVIYRAEKGKKEYSPITSLIPYFGIGEKDVLQYRFIDNGIKPGVKYEYRMEVVDSSDNAGKKPV